jgi:DUF2933 family protein
MNGDNGNSKWPAVRKYVFIGFALIAGYFLITEHRAHVVQYLPFVLLLACPLLHFFHGHGGHQGHGGGAENDGKSRKGPEPPQHHHH